MKGLRVYYWFQSLFSWNLLLNSNLKWSRNYCSRFQSLFSWNLLLNFDKTYAGSVFELAFQSLFSWNLLLNLSGPLEYSHQHRVSILVFVELALECQTGPRSKGLYYVSILVFVELALEFYQVAGITHQNVMFQSLFSWNLLLNGVLLFEFVAKSGFQSLFSWNLLLNVFRFGIIFTYYCVSILVFVELALECHIRPNTGCRRLCFNPCFRGTCS